MLKCRHMESLDHNKLINKTPTDLGDHYGKWCPDIDIDDQVLRRLKNTSWMVESVLIWGYFTSMV